VKRLRTPLLLIAALFCVGLAACGDGSSSSSTVATRSQQASSAPRTRAAPGAEQQKGSTEAGSGEAAASFGGAEQAKQAGDEPAFKPRAHHDSAGGVAQFEVKGGDNSIQEYGREGSEPEFAEAATALHNYLDARAAGAWSAACRYLASETTKQLVAQLNADDGGSSCAEVMAVLSTGLPRAALRQAAVADAGALRAEGSHGFLLFHGAGGTVYFMPMVRERGHWRVAAVAASAAP
jgi:hypothetical protein